jgi:hypothetical protein
MKSGDGFHLHLPPGGCRAFESVHSQPPVENSYVISQIIEVNASWSVARQEQVTIEEDIESEFQPSAFKPCILRDYSMNESTTGLCQENGESPCSEYSGSLIYRTQLTIPAIPVNSRVILDIGTVYYSAEVWLNGQSIGRRAWSPFWFDVTEFMRFGEMELQIRTTNTLANQWMQPDIHARDVSKFGNMYLSTASSFMVESLHAGLAGPIQLRVYTTIP